MPRLLLNFEVIKDR